MNWEHLKTYVWVRWRLSANQVRRSGAVGIIVAAILTGMRIMGGIMTFLVGLLLGFFALGHASAEVLVFTWDGIAGAFIFFWIIGLITELQRSELLSLDNFMHLPVSPTGAFLINYVGSSIGLDLILFLPGTVGLSIGLVLSRGPKMLLLFPLIAVFFLLVTSVTHQFRGWLAGMMSNPRRRRMIVAIVSITFILIFQIPNILTNINPGAGSRRQAGQEITREFSALKKELDEGRITREEYQKQILAKQAVVKANRDRKLEQFNQMIQTINMIVPPGWLPYGAGAADQGRYLTALACMCGMGLVGAASLRRSYRTTLRLYRGDFGRKRTERKARFKPITKDLSAAKSVSARAASALEKRLPWISDQASAVTFMSLRSLLRAPEVKMLMLTPVIILIVFGGVILSKGGNVSGLFRPLIALGFAAFILVISMAGIAGNQFAFDRNGFRTFVLSCAPRRDILLGRNLSLLPMAIVSMTFAIGLSQWRNPMRWDHLAAVFLLMLPMYLLFCLVANVLSILAPITLKPGSGQPASHQGLKTLLHLVFIAVVPVPLSFTLIPLGMEALCVRIVPAVRFPVFLLFSAIELAVVVWLYRMTIKWQGALLQRREQKILEAVGAKGE